MNPEQLIQAVQDAEAEVVAKAAALATCREEYDAAILALSQANRALFNYLLGQVGNFDLPRPERRTKPKRKPKRKG